MNNKEMRGILAGMILGDGNMQKGIKNINPCIRINHSSKQREYLIHKIALLQPLFHYKLSFQEKRIHNNKTNKDYNVCIFSSRVSSKLKTIWKYSYKNGKKTINRQLLNCLTPQGIAIWYMDDGCCNYKNRTVIISTYCSEEEAKIIKDYFKEVWGVEFIVKRWKTHYYIGKGWRSEDMRKFMNIINPYIIPEMQYKLVDFYSSSHPKRNFKVMI